MLTVKKSTGPEILSFSDYAAYYPPWSWSQYVPRKRGVTYQEAMFMVHEFREEKRQKYNLPRGNCIELLLPRNAYVETTIHVEKCSS